MYTYRSLHSAEAVMALLSPEDNSEDWSTQEGSISSDSRLLHSSNCIMTSSSSKYSVLRAKRNWLPLADEQQMPESSDPRLDWSKFPKFGVELAVVMVTLFPVTVALPFLESLLLRAWSTGLEEADAEADEPNSTVSTARATGSALPHTTPNLIILFLKIKQEIKVKNQNISTFILIYLRLSLNRNKLLQGSSERDKEGFKGGCCWRPLVLVWSTDRWWGWLWLRWPSAEAEPETSGSNSGIFCRTESKLLFLWCLLVLVIETR